MVYNKGMAKLVCSICGKGFKNKAGLMGHIAGRHEGRGGNPKWKAFMAEERLKKGQQATLESILRVSCDTLYAVLLHDGADSARAKAVCQRYRGSPGRNEIGKGGLLNADSPVAFTRQGEVGGTEPPPTTHTTHGLPRQENGRRGGAGVAEVIEWCSGKK